MTANQEEISDHETFQLEFDAAEKRWYLRTMQDKYFTLGAGGGVQANETKRFGSYYDYNKFNLPGTTTWSTLVEGDEQQDRLLRSINLELI